MSGSLTLKNRHCTHCDGAAEPLSGIDAQPLLAELSAGWVLDGAAKEIRQEFRFKNFYHTMAFVNALAWIAHQENHHPELEVGYDRCLVRYSTHSIAGLSVNDFICAAKIDALDYCNRAV
ncbi:4a-hydroxytetrahydrobiopterin dehydratase [Amphritea sp.]|uniref:4a-hydroxytetrahydrobiopterin dehydratase n=1 Tax=Amphritea sp. TaxID=1872502 RepID=UPI003D0AD5E6